VSKMMNLHGDHDVKKQQKHSSSSCYFVDDIININIIINDNDNDDNRV
jgi:hypothetical protein